MSEGGRNFDTKCGKLEELRCNILAAPSGTKGRGLDISIPTPPLSSPHPLPHSQLAEENCNGGLHYVDVQEGGYRTGGRHDYPWILQPHLLTTKEERRTPPYYRPFCIKPSYRHSFLPYGKRPVSQGQFNSGTVGSVHRPTGRLFSHPSAQKFPKIPSFLHQQQGMAVQGPPLRTVGSSCSVHGGLGTREHHLPQERYQTTHVPRRLADSGKFAGGGEIPRDFCHRTYENTWTHFKSQEESINTDSELYIPGLPLQPAGGDGRAHSGEHFKNCCQGTVPDYERSGNGRGLALNDRLGERRSVLDPVRPIACLSNGDPCKATLAVGPRRPKSPETDNSSLQRDERNPTLVDISKRLESESNSLPLQGGQIPIYGCKPVWVGSPHGTSDSFRCMDCCREGGAHKCVGVPSGVSRTVETPYGPPAHLCAPLHRQHHNDGLYQQGGGHQVPPYVLCYTRPAALVPRHGDSPQSCPHHGINECHGGLIVEGCSHHQHRVEPSPSSGTTNVVQVVHPKHRPVRNFIQQKVSKLRQSLSRRGSSGSRRPRPQLGQSSSVRVPTVRSTKKGDPKIGTISELPDAASSTLLAQPVLVRDFNRTESHPTVPTTKKVRPAKAARPGALPPKSGAPRPSRLELIQQNLNACGLPKGVTEIMAKATRASTLSLYDKRWASFERWGVQTGVNPLEATVPEILQYLDFLRTTLNLTPGTIVGHKTAIVVTIASSSNRRLHDNLIIKQYIKGLLTTATPRSTVPDWDLSIVLDALRRAPFEPLSSCEPKYLTFKTVFLLAFATAARRSELHALSKDFLRDERWTYVTFKTIPGFIAKNQKGADFRSFTIRSLSDFTNSAGLEEERLLCPVRALRVYSNRTLRSSDNVSLFVSFKKGHTTNIHPNTISSWLKQCIRLCYELSGKPLPSKVVGHSVRAMATSWASLKNVGLHQILDSCFWKNPNTFISFYLKDMTAIEGSMRKLGKVSVSSTTV